MKYEDGLDKNNKARLDLESRIGNIIGQYGIVNVLLACAKYFKTDDRYVFRVHRENLTGAAKIAQVTCSDYDEV